MYPGSELNFSFSSLGSVAKMPHLKISKIAADPSGAGYEEKA
jgi:hypothetical protein